MTIQDLSPREQQIFAETLKGARFKFPESGEFNSHIGRFHYVTNKAEQLQLFGNSNASDKTEKSETWRIRISVNYTKPAYFEAFQRWVVEFVQKHFDKMQIIGRIVHETGEDLGIKPQADLLLEMIPPRQVDLVRETLLQGIMEHFGKE